MLVCVHNAEWDYMRTFTMGNDDEEGAEKEDEEASEKHNV